MTQSQLCQRIEPLLTECCTALLDSYGVSVRCEGTVDRAEVMEAGIVAFIGFLGESIRGSLVISAPAQLISQALPVTLGKKQIIEDAQRDWACELANQLLGRLKLRLCMFGVDFDMSTPSAVMGRELRGFKASDSNLVVKFAVDDMPLYVEMDLSVTAVFEMLDAPIPGEVSLLEGEMMMLF